jgi:hypothetical protein
MTSRQLSRWVRHRLFFSTREIHQRSLAQNKERACSSPQTPEQPECGNKGAFQNRKQRWFSQPRNCRQVCRQQSLFFRHFPKTPLHFGGAGAVGVGSCKIGATDGRGVPSTGTDAVGKKAVLRRIAALLSSRLLELTNPVRAFCVLSRLINSTICE